MMAKEKKDGFLLWLIKYFFRFIFSFVWSVIRIPYWIVLGIIWLARKIGKKSVERAIDKKRESMNPLYSELEVVKTISGGYEEWEKNLFDSL